MAVGTQDQPVPARAIRIQRLENRPDGTAAQTGKHHRSTPAGQERGNPGGILMDHLQSGQAKPLLQGLQLLHRRGGAIDEQHRIAAEL